MSPQGFEPRTHGLEGRCSIQLSYEPTPWLILKNGADDENRTHAISLEGWGSTIELHPHDWSGRRDSNSRPSPWQGDALPLSHFRILVEGDGFEPSKAQLTDLQSAPFGHSGIPRYTNYLTGAGGGNRTPNLLITNQLLYRWATPAYYWLKKLATENGLEPSTSSVTGWHSNQLNYQAMFLVYGGSYRARTCDPLLVRQMLSQLS